MSLFEFSGTVKILVYKRNIPISTIKKEFISCKLFAWVTAIGHCIFIWILILIGNVQNINLILIWNLYGTAIYTVEPVYTGQPQGITKVAFVDKWPKIMFGASETTYPIFTGHIKTGLCRQESTIRRCCYAQVWLYISFFIYKIWLADVLSTSQLVTFWF